MNINKKYRYRSDVDGLRAVAVLGVLFFHAGLGCPGGFVGVDVFFVISGFLITSLILRDLREGVFSFFDFWARRIRRILPALTVLLAVVVVVGYFGMFPHDYELLGKQIISVVCCVSNVKFWRESGYFESASNEKPLLHTWSLSVEEQFYFIIPLALFFVFRLKRENLALPLIVFTCIVSFAASVYYSNHDPSANFFLLPTRAWELGIGSLLAYARPISSSKLREVVALIGLALIIGCYFLLSEDVSFPGVSALPSVCGAALFIWSGIGQTKLSSAGRLLALKPIVGIGLISYSLYLWHWPVFAYQEYLGYSKEFQSIQLILAGGSFIPAWLSWKFVETPFRTRQICSSRKAIVAFGGGVAAALTVFGVTSIWSEGSLGRFSKIEMLKVRKSLESKVKSDFDDLKIKKSGITTKFLGLEGEVDFVVWGDSHARSLGNTFSVKAKELGSSGVLFAQNGGLPLLEVNFAGEQLGVVNREITDKILELNPRVVFFVCRWAKVKTNRLTSDVIGAREAEGYQGQSLEYFDISLGDTVEKFSKNGIIVYLLGDVPLSKKHVPAVWFSDQLNLPLRKKIPTSTLAITLEDYTEKQGEVNLILDKIASDRENVFSLPLKRAVFPQGQVFVPFNERATFYYDRSHLNDFGADIVLGDFIKRYLKKTGNGKGVE